MSQAWTGEAKKALNVSFRLNPANTVIHHCDRKYSGVSRSEREKVETKEKKMVLNCEWEALWWVDLFLLLPISRCRPPSIPSLSTPSHWSSSTIIKFYVSTNFRGDALLLYLLSMGFFFSFQRGIEHLFVSLWKREPSGGGIKNRSALNLHFGWIITNTNFYVDSLVMIVSRQWDLRRELVRFLVINEGRKISLPNYLSRLICSR